MKPNAAIRYSAKVLMSCRFKLQRGKEFCVNDCPATAPSGVFRYVRVQAQEDVPPPDKHSVDIAVLDMNHGWPNLGHDSLVHVVRETGCDLLPDLEGTGLAIRVISYDVRRGCVLPEPPGERFAIYLGTGGPGHPDPRWNDGIDPLSQGIKDDPSWEAQLFALFDAIRADKCAALLAVCHTFEELCRWSGAARPVQRGPEKGGKSSGILENILTPEATRHPWFSRFAADLADGRRYRILDSRLFDMIPDQIPSWVTPLSYETIGIGGPPGDALTMIEMARDPAGVMPRMLAVNHHPEIVSRSRSLMILDKQFADHDVSSAWYQERRQSLTQAYPGEDSERLLNLTSDYTLLGPLQYHLHRQVRLRAELLGIDVDIHEERVQERDMNATEGDLGRLQGAGILRD